MLEKIVLEEKEIQGETIERLLGLSKIFMNSAPEIDKEEKESCILDTANLNLAKSKLIRDLVVNLSTTIQGSK